MAAPRSGVMGQTGPAIAETVSGNMALLDQASKGVMTLLARHQQLQAHVRQVDAWSKAQIQAAEAAADRSRAAAAAAENKLQLLQDAFDAMRRRAEAAEQALERDGSTLDALQSRIIAAFGFGAGANDGLAPAGRT